MIEKLKTKWGVNNTNLFLIICTFAFGGSLCGFIGRKVLWLVGFDKSNFFYWPSYFIAITLLWPFCVILVSLITGQFTFFRNYLKRVLKRFGSK